jgi:hypothetical protein
MEGRKCKAYLNTGTYASKTWTEIKRMTDTKRPQSRSSSEFKMRGFQTIVAATGYKKYGVTFKYQTKSPAGTADTIEAALQTAYDNDADIEIAMVDRPIATVGAKGTSGFFRVTKFDRDEADEDNVSYDVELMPADHEESGTPVEVGPYTTPA